jgi:hypothetical protein
MARPKKIKDTPVDLDPKAYGKFIQGLEIQQVLLVRSSIERFGFPSADTTLSFELTGAAAELTRFDDNSGFVARLPYTTDLVFHGSPENEPVRFATISVTFEAIYSTEIPITDAIFETFKDYNLRLNLWSYVREFIQSTTLRMGFPGLVLPHLKVL